jgi:transcriptional regulator with XRE-family HTH domain
VALLRRVIGDALRARRQGQRRTLRDVSTAANVSLGYLSEIERGQKEASSELLAAICEALGSHVSEVLRDATDSLAQVERADGVLTEAPLAEVPVAEPTPVPEPALAPAGSVTDGQVSVSVRRDGPLRTTLRAVRSRPRQPVGPRR